MNPRVMRQNFNRALCVASTAVCNPAYADTTVATVRGWEVIRSDTDCNAVSEFTDGTSLEFGLSLTSKQSTLILWNGKWSSIRKDAAYTITISFDGADEEEHSASGMKTADAGGIFMSFSEYGILPAAMGAKAISIWNGTKFIGKYNLTGSNAALLAVARCVGKVANTPSADPFLDR